MKLLGLSGSLRAASLNTRLVRVAGEVWNGAFEMGDLRLPLYDGDLEDQGIPDDVMALSDAIAGADAVVVATPEYNQSMSGVVKNALDWISRTRTKPWERKPVALMSAAAGRSGGARANYALRLAMTPFRPRLLTEELLVAGARKAFDDEGRLVDEGAASRLTMLMERLAEEAAR